MQTIKPTAQEQLFTPMAIEQQVDRITLDSRFRESEILKKFLVFIVRETIADRPNCLKEYTIAINVLGKPVSFNPQENGLVRIHAGRLRRALAEYYTNEGTNDPIIIEVPKGKYVPVFYARNDPAMFFHEPTKIHDLSIQRETAVTGFTIMPFICSSAGGRLLALSEGICLQLSSALVALNKVKVIAYQAAKYFASKQEVDFKDLGESLGISHVITGGIQYFSNKIRVNVQLIECSSYKQVLSDSYERGITGANLFEVEDEVCIQIIQKIEGFMNCRKSIPMLSAI